ncbi:MAG: MBL fold metallo-hydrolase [Candidatus Lokiarchaeota archaeon]|nr:MBL fold metallo-hydrolase [Candidatus Lokiarchaeota archaeon]
MSIDISEGMESGKVTIKVLSTNEVSLTLLAEEKFKGKVTQPGATANRVVGEHGLAMSISIVDNEEKHLFLMDTGGLSQAIVHNSKQLGVNLGEVEKFVLSHGHFDHFGGISEVFPLFNKGTEIYLNPICFSQNYIAIMKSGEEIPANVLGESLRTLGKEGKLSINKKLPLLSKNMITNLVDQYGLNLIETKEPQRLFKGILTSGEIELFDKNERTKGIYIQKSKKEFVDHYFRDETSIYINVKGKGLVVLTGCGHCGIINTIKHGQKLTGVDKIYAVIGGFHEEWNSIEKIEEKVKFFETLSPEITCGMHCTGFKFNKLMSRHPSHTLGIVGTEFHL